MPRRTVRLSNPDGSLIEFVPGVSGQITLSSTLALTETDGPEVIEGPGANLLTVSGNNAAEVFQIDNTASLAGLTISGGLASGAAGGCGGGITNNGTLTITGCTITDNSAANGGGIYNGSECTLTVTNTTISGNSASVSAGGIDNGTACWLTVINSTIADNSANALGSGITNVGDMMIVNTTIAYNSDGGINSNGNTLSCLVTLDNSIVALNTAGDNGPANDITGVVSSSSANNMIGVGGSGGLANCVNGNIIGAANPELGTLANNGGPTQTIALLTRCPAINAGSNALAVDANDNELTTDERGGGYPRILCGTVDIGAFESSVATPVIAWSNPATITYGTTLSSQQLDATASYNGLAVLGTFLYTASNGTVLTSGTTLSAGQGQTLTVTFSPYDAVDFTTATMSVTININKANPTINIDGYGVTFDGQAHSAIGTATGVGGATLSGLILDGTKHTLAAMYADTWSFIDTTGDYNNANGMVDDIINKAVPIMTVSDAGGTYDGLTYPATPSLSTIEGVPVTLDYRQNGTDLGLNAPVNSGTYLVTANFGGSPDYSAASSSPSQFTIAQATPTLTVMDPGGIYDGSAYPAIPSVLNIGGVAVTLDYHENGYDLGPNAPIHAGNYVVTAKVGGSTDYSSSSSGPVQFTIGTAALTITANAATSVYGEGLPALTASYKGFVTGDIPASLSTPPVLSTSATAFSHAGDYPITASGARDPDYTIRYVAGTLLITPAPLWITASNATKVYGAGLPVLTATYTGLVNGDSPASLSVPPAMTTSASAGSPVLTAGYVIKVSGASDPDYAINDRPGLLFITPAPLRISANNLSMIQGTAVPPLTASYQGLVNGDSAASLTTGPTLTTPASGASLPGTYPISVEGARSLNYVISYANGSLLITPMPVSLSGVSIQSIRLGKSKKATQVIVFQFTGLLNPGSIQATSSYGLTTVPANKKRKSQIVALSQAQYNAATKTVTLITRKPLVLNPPLKITFNLLDIYDRTLSGGATLSKNGIAF